MAKTTTLFVCQNCGERYPKWMGQCTSCSEWNTLVEELKEHKSKKSSPSSSTIEKMVISYPEVEPLKGLKRRFSTQIGELDRVLGGEENNKGVVPGAVMLIGGEPGIGKSTLLTQLVVEVLAREPETRVLYVSGEESPSQISLRIKRLMENEHKNITLENLSFVTSTDVDEVVAVLEQHKPNLAIVDSIQTLTTGELTGASGSVGQLRESAERLTRVAKAYSIPIFLVGHVTKEGTIAGPKVLEHIVDSVLELSGERTGQLRLLRAIKNRFGATDEVGVFRVEEYGLISVANPSELFLEHATKPVAGSAVVCVMEGTRPLLVEVQALVVGSQLAMPRRVGRGIELSRIQVLSAVLQKHSKLPLGTSDIFLSAAGGFIVREPAVDLGLAVAMASSLKNKPISAGSLFIGEVGLLGEIRSVSYLERRIKEAKRLGYTKILSRQTHGSVKEVLGDLGLL